MESKTFELVKGDSILLEGSLNADITNWKIRAKIYDDCGHCINLATANVEGGSVDQIQIINIDLEASKFNIQVAKGRTTDFNKDSFIEVEVETTETVGGEPEVNTPFIGNIKFIGQKIK